MARQNVFRPLAFDLLATYDGVNLDIYKTYNFKRFWKMNFPPGVINANFGFQLNQHCWLFSYTSSSNIYISRNNGFSFEILRALSYSGRAFRTTAPMKEWQYFVETNGTNQTKVSRSFDKCNTFDIITLGHPGDLVNLMAFKNGVVVVPRVGQAGDSLVVHFGGTLLRTTDYGANWNIMNNIFGDATMLRANNRIEQSAHDYELGRGIMYDRRNNWIATTIDSGASWNITPASSIIATHNPFICSVSRTGRFILSFTRPSAFDDRFYYSNDGITWFQSVLNFSVLSKDLSGFVRFGKNKFAAGVVTRSAGLAVDWESAFSVDDGATWDIPTNPITKNHNLPFGETENGRMMVYGFDDGSVALYNELTFTRDGVNFSTPTSFDLGGVGVTFQQPAIGSRKAL